MGVVILLVTYVLVVLSGMLQSSLVSLLSILSSFLMLGLEEGVA